MQKITKKDKQWFIEMKGEALQIFTFKDPRDVEKEFDGKYFRDIVVPTLRARGWYSMTVNGLKTFMQTEEFHQAINS